MLGNCMRNSIIPRWERNLTAVGIRWFVGTFYPLEIVFAQYFAKNTSNISEIGIDKFLNLTRMEYTMMVSYMENDSFGGWKFFQMSNFLPSTYLANNRSHFFRVLNLFGFLVRANPKDVLNFAKGRDLEWKCAFFPRQVLNNNDINTYEKWPFIGKEKRSRQETLNAKSQIKRLIIC